MSDTEPFSSGSSDIYQSPVYESCSTSSDDDGSDVGLLTFQNQTNEANDKGGLIKTENVERERSKTGTGKKRSCSHKYYIKLGNRNIQICRNGFASIHGISKKRVDNVAKRYRDPTVTTPAQSNRGKHQNRPNRIPSEWVSKVDSHIRSFPRRESHYSRNKSSRYYPSPELNIKRMYELYLKKHELGLEASAKPIVSFDFYYRYFKQNFKYSFGSPRSDTCKKCDMLSNKLKDKTLDSDETQQIQIEKSSSSQGRHFFC
ncbi:unnamed protein product [Parnassius apollo]|uniref:(apollo) hypothetical protein n=1 Tax=Parnassius apollo TaxID=110799 RepID=A0A8S3XHD6_PARAO|nr:unnamed protein product [Parnassius apollo]